MATAAQILAQHLVNRGTCVATTGNAATWPVKVSQMPTVPASGVNKNFVAVYDSGDEVRPRDMPGGNPLRFNCQAKVRATTYPIGEAQARRILADMQDLARDAGGEVVTVSGTDYQVDKCVLTIGVTHMGQDPDQENLNFFSINCRLTLGE